MEHLLPRPDNAWRRAAFVVGAIAAAELAALLVLGLPMLVDEVGDRVRASASDRTVAALEPKQAPPPRREEPAGVAAARAETAVLVLNGNGVAGAASSLGDRVHGLGYIVAGVGNAPRNDYRRSLVMYRAGREPEARRLAKELGVRVVAPLDGIGPDELLGAHVAVVLGGS